MDIKRHNFLVFYKWGAGTGFPWYPCDFCRQSKRAPGCFITSKNSSLCHLRSAKCNLLVNCSLWTQDSAQIKVHRLSFIRSWTVACTALCSFKRHRYCHWNGKKRKIVWCFRWFCSLFPSLEFTNMWAFEHEHNVLPRTPPEKGSK